MQAQWNAQNHPRARLLRAGTRRSAAKRLYSHSACKVGARFFWFSHYVASISSIVAGVGNFTQTLVMVILMAAFQQTGLSAVLSPHRLEIVWRLQYAFIALVLLILTFYRILRLQESEVWKTAAPLQHVPGSPSPQPQLSDAAAVGQPTHAHGDSANTSNRKDCIQTEATTGFGSGAPLDDSFNMSPSNRSGTGQEHDAGRASSPNSSPPLIKTPSNSVWKLVFVFLRTNWHRLIGTSIGWFVWDIAFYGTYAAAGWHFLFDCSGLSPRSLAAFDDITQLPQVCFFNALFADALRVQATSCFRVDSSLRFMGTRHRTSCSSGRF